MTIKNRLPFFLLPFLLTGCLESNPNLNQAGEDILEINQSYVGDIELPHRDTMYIPIYSDIYVKTRNTRFYLTATLSIRNTSLTDTIYIEDIDYYDTDGSLVRQYLHDALLLRPMQSIEYVVNEDDVAGGAGANFIVNWGAQTDQVIPVFHGVMISTNGQQGISFLTEGVSIKKRNPVSDSSRREVSETRVPIESKEMGKREIVN